MIKYLIFSMLSLFLWTQGYPQLYRYRGVVKDAQTQEAIPFAHCKIVGSNTGFVTDLNGAFSYATSQKSLEITVSSIGYTKHKVTLKPNVTTELMLTQSTQTLSEVVVTYVDRERELLQKVLDHIPQNYPQQTERITGTIVEQLAKDSLYKDLIYIAKSTVEADKLTYSNKNVYSSVKVLDGEVEYFMPMDSSFTRIYAGVHNQHRFDIIAARIAPFDQVKNKKYIFDLVDTLVYENKALFKLRFQASKYKGFLYIQDSTFALVKAEYSVLEEKMNTVPINGKRLFLHFTTEYFKDDRQYRIGYINYQSGFSKAGKSTEKIFLNNFFYLNSHEPTSDLIELKEQTDFTAVLIDELPMKKTEATANLGRTKRKNAFYKVIKNITATQGLGLWTYSPQVNTNSLFGSVIDQDNPIQRLIYFSGVGYKLSKTFTLGVTTQVAYL